MNNSQNKNHLMLFLLTAAFALNHLDRQVLNIVLNDIGTEFNFTDLQLGTLSGFAFAIIYAVNIKMENGTLVTPSVGLSGIWNFDVRGNSTQNASQGFGLGVDDLHARIDAGISATNLDGTVFKLEGYYDGLGVSNYSATGINVRFVMPLN